jgi:hypothetical protein
MELEVEEDLGGSGRQEEHLSVIFLFLDKLRRNFSCHFLCWLEIAREELYFFPKIQ